MTGMRVSSIVIDVSSAEKPAGHRPWTESNSNKCACIAGSPVVSLTKAILSLRSSKGRSTSLPMRPKPLIAYVVIMNGPV